VAGASRAFRVFPGERRVLKKQGAVVTECGRVVMTAGTQQQITC
jgi:hypothetical protein